MSIRAAFSKSKLLAPYVLPSGLVLKNRMMLGALTRARSDPESHCITDLNVDYYAMRTGFGLIVTEAAAVSPHGFGWYGAPAMYNETHLPGWIKLVSAVHACDGIVFAQLSHMGRQAHPSFNTSSEVVSASANRLKGRLRNSSGEPVEFDTPRALETRDIASVIDDFTRAAWLARRVGFDGIDILAGNGNLVDQFLQSTTNHRTDKYGGSIANRARFLFELLDALEAVWPPSRIGLRLSPNGVFGGMGSHDNFAQFTYTIDELDKRRGQLAYLHVANASRENHGLDRIVTYADIRAIYSGTIVANGAYTRDTADAAIRSGDVDLVAFGRSTIANPDLPERFGHDWPVEPEAPRQCWWNAAAGAHGYTTYTAYKPARDE